MKQTWKKLLVGCLAVILACSMVACDLLLPTGDISTESLTETNVETDVETDSLDTESMTGAESDSPEAESSTDTEETTSGKKPTYVPIPADPQTCEQSVNIDDEYYVYYFYLGEIRDTPIYSSVALQYMYDEQVTFTFNKITQEAVERQLTTSTEIVNKTAYTGGFTVSGEVDAGVVKVGLSTDHHWTKEWENALTTAETNISSYVNANVDSLSTTVSFSEKEHTKGHFYRFSLYETVKAYGIVVYDVQAQTYSVTYQTLLDSTAKTRVWEESSDGVFRYEKGGELILDTNVAIEYASTNTPATKVETETPEAEKISVTMNRYSCSAGNSYDKEEQESNEYWRSRHDGYEIGRLNLYGCTEAGGVYTVVDPSEFALRYEVIRDLDDLPRVGNAELTRIDSDSATSVKGTNIDSKIGCGASWVRITYTDDSQSVHKNVDVLKHATEGTFVTFVEAKDIDTTKTIAKIEVVLAYELYCGGPGFLGIWWHEYPNWRCEYTFNFHSF